MIRFSLIILFCFFSTSIANAQQNPTVIGIELISLIDANSIIARMPQKLKKKIPLDNRLIKNLDVDIRILMDWNVDRADMDLHIIEPSKERASYGNQLTKSGGQISNDMTEGYGPEQYQLRKAKKGQYTVISDVYSTDAYNPNGAITLRARMFKNFGRKSQTMETVILEFTETSDDDGSNDEYTLGYINVEK